MTTRTEQPTVWAQAFVDHLVALRENKAALSALRRGLRQMPRDATRAHRYLASFVPDKAVGSGKEYAVYTVGALFATYPDLAMNDDSLGTNLGALAKAEAFSADGIERRLHHLVRSSDSANLARALPPVIALLAAGGGAISWSGLASDIDRWDRWSGQVSHRWLRNYYRATNDKHADDDLALTTATKEA